MAIECRAGSTLASVQGPFAQFLEAGQWLSLSYTLYRELVREKAGPMIAVLVEASDAQEVGM